MGLIFIIGFSRFSCLFYSSYCYIHWKSYIVNYFVAFGHYFSDIFSKIQLLDLQTDALGVVTQTLSSDMAEMDISEKLAAKMHS